VTGRRRWSLETARALVPEVRSRTAEAVAAVEKLEERRDGLQAGDPARVAVEQDLARAVSTWVRAMEALGVEVKGPWLVDFDNGEGYYCWRWPEEELCWFHGYDEGVAGRIRIQ
jgi:hypothetical protein